MAKCPIFTLNAAGWARSVPQRRGSCRYCEPGRTTSIVHPLLVWPQGESVQMFLHTDIGKHPLDNAQPAGMDVLALSGIDLCLDRIDQVRRLVSRLDGKKPARSRWLAQQCARNGQAAQSCGWACTQHKFDDANHVHQMYSSPRMACRFAAVDTFPPAPYIG